MASQSTKPALPEVEPTYDPTRPPPEPTVLYQYPLPNVPGFTLLAIQVRFPPNGSTPPHTHPGAFVGVSVLKGHIFNKMNDDKMICLGPGEAFKDAPGCRHRISDNASTTEEAVLIASFVVDSEVLKERGVQGMVLIDEEWREAVEKVQRERAGL